VLHATCHTAPHITIFFNVSNGSLDGAKAQPIAPIPQGANAVNNSLAWSAESFFVIASISVLFT